MPSTIVGNTTLSGPLPGRTNIPVLVGQVNQLTLLFHADLLILGFFALAFLAVLPHAIVRFSKGSEWSDGHFLRSEKSQPRPRRDVAHHPQSPATPSALTSPSDFSARSDETHSSYVSQLYRQYSEKSSRNGTHRTTTAYPPHLAASPRFLRRIVNALRHRVSSGYTILHLIISTVWFCILIYPSLLKSSGPFTDPLRLGWVAVSQIPFSFALGAKNGLVGALLGLGYQKLNVLHRFIGRIVVLSSNVHAFGYIYKWLLDGSFSQMFARPKTYWAFVALACINCLFVFSTEWWRKKVYNVFLVTHIISYILLLPALHLHGKGMLPYIFACLCVMAMDRIFRMFKTRFCTATIRPIHELGSTRIEIPGIAGWRAGQHVRIRVLSGAMGWFGWSEIHPFTIASASGSNSGLVLLCKKGGSWTNKLYEMATVKGYLEEGGPGRKVNLLIQGPYGGPGHSVMSSYSAAVFVVGGSGISFALASIQELLRKDYVGESRVRHIELIWIVRDPSALVPLMPQFTSMLQQSSSVMTTFKISVFYTRAPIGKFPFADDYFSHPNLLSLSPGRPKVGKILESVTAQLVRLGTARKSRGPITGMLVAVCGPMSLADDVSAQVAKLDPARRDQIGGIELLEEAFNL